MWHVVKVLLPPLVHSLSHSPVLNSLGVYLCLMYFFQDHFFKCLKLDWWTVYLPDVVKQTGPSFDWHCLTSSMTKLFLDEEALWYLPLFLFLLSCYCFHYRLLSFLSFTTLKMHGDSVGVEKKASFKAFH